MTSQRGGPKKLGKYEILEVIGRGGMGVVYKAIDPEIGRTVGIKMMTSAVINDPDLLKRFYREAQSSGKLQHPNIITIYDLGVHETTPYLVMEFLEGESLDSTIKARRAISSEDKLNIGIQVCNALAYAHERGIVHRDIKPGNVMLLRDGTVKIVDFGIARMGGDKVTRTGQVMGSVQYMSPEQINGAHVDHRSDIFSAGVLLYQLLTYVLPFEGKDTGDTLLKIIHGTPPPLNQYVHDCPAELETILLRALAKNPEERFQTATELALDLSHIQDELKHARVSEYLQTAEDHIAHAHWAKAQEQLLQVLKLDRQNTRSSALLRQVQQEIQKQQRSERAQDLRSQADQALSKGELDDALRYLGMAVDLVPTDTELVQLRDSVKESKAIADRLNELLRRAESAHDGGELEEALAATHEALALDRNHSEAKALRAVITREIADRAKLKQVQSFIDEARKQISSRRFTAALEVLKKAESLDPSATGINELISLASTGQQQERRRKDLEQIAADVQEALNNSQHTAACKLVEEGLRKFPEDRGLLKLKALADKEREAHEKRAYIESRVSTARRLLEEHRTQEALPALEEALARYPEEFVLQTMRALVMETIEREQIEQFKTQTIQQAKDAIRRKAYSEAIAILRSAQQHTPSTEFEDLLQFASDEAAAHEKQLVIDAAAEEAHRLISAEDYQSAMSLLEMTLKNVDDQELRIILSDAQRQLERFNIGVQETIAAANRLQQSQRFSEAVKLMEGQLHTYGKSSDFCSTLEALRQEERRLHALSGVKEGIRDALANSNYEHALARLEAFQQQFGGSLDTQLLRNEIDARREKAATLAVEQALKDIRILLLVNSNSTALGLLDRVAGDVVRVAPELRDKYETLRKRAETAYERELYQKEQFRLRQMERAEQISDQPTLDQARITGGSRGAINRTRKASPAELEKLLGEVTVIGNHYAEDPTIQNEISNLKDQLTGEIASLRQTEILDEPTLAVPPEIEKSNWQMPETRVDFPEQTESEDLHEPILDKTLVSDPVVEVHEEPDLVDPSSNQSRSEPIADLPALAAAAPQAPSLEEATFRIPDPPLAEPKEWEEMPAARNENEKEEEESEKSIHLVTDSAIADNEQPTVLQPRSSEEQAPLEVAEALQFPVSDQSPMPPRITTSPIPQEREIPEQPALAKSESFSQSPPSAASEPRPQAPPLPRRPSPTRDSASRSVPSQPGAWRTSPVLAAIAFLSIVLVWAGIHFLTPHAPKVVSTPTKGPGNAQPPVNPIELRQKQAIADSDKRVALGDLEGARQILQQAAGLSGPLTAEVNQQLASIADAMKDEGLRKQRQREEQLWEQAQTDVDAGRFAAAQNSLRQILALPDGATRKDKATQYLNDIIPKRKREESLFAQAQRAAHAGDSASLQRAEDLFGRVTALDGPRKAEAEQERSKIHDRLATGLKQQRDQQIATLQGEAHQALKDGDIRGARQKADDIKQLGADTAALSAEIDQADKVQQAKSNADATFQRVVQQYRSASAASDKLGLESVRKDLATIAQTGGPHAVDAQNYLGEIDKKLAALNSPPAAHPPAKRPGPSPTDFEAIRAAVHSYGDAFEHRDADALRQIWPSMDPSMYSSYKTNFGNASSIRMEVDIGSVDVSVDQGSATVSATVTQKYTPKGFSARNSKDTAVFHLVKKGDSWLITDVH